MDDVEVQLGEEIVSRLRVIALFEPGIARSLIDETRAVASLWARGLESDGVAADTSSAVYEALWPSPPPASWWTTPVGARLAVLGVDPGGEVTVREASEMLGWSTAKTRRQLGPGTHPLRQVLDLAAQQTAD